MKKKLKYDFSGWATRNDLVCSDGRTIRRDAFAHCDGKTVPLVWNHQHDDPTNILGHALLENREDGVYAYCTFNETAAGKAAKLIVQHGDVDSLSIYANGLKQQGGNVMHGDIKELSLVVAGANPGAFIDFVDLAHGEGAEQEVKVTGLTTKVNDLVTAGGEPNKLEGIKVNGTLLALTDKIADILIAEGKTNGTISANGVDIPVHGLAALAYKSEVAESDLAAALKAIIDAKAKQADLDTLTGNGEGSISKMIDAAINKFATDVTDDNVVNSYKELIDWVAKHGPEATKMAGGISENKTAIADLKTLVGTLPEGATSTTVVAYITEAINALSIGDYAKTTEVTAAINTALESYYTKTQVDETFVKKTDIVMATDAEVDAMLTEVFGAQATV